MRLLNPPEWVHALLIYSHTDYSFWGTQSMEVTSENPRSEADIMLDAQRTHHMVILKMHLNTIRVFMEPIIEKELYDHSSKILHLCEVYMEEKSTDLITSMLANMVRQLNSMGWKKNEPVDLLKYMESGGELFIAFNLEERVVSIPMHLIFSSLRRKLDKITFAKTCVTYCRDVVYVEFASVLCNKEDNQQDGGTDDESWTQCGWGKHI